MTNNRINNKSKKTGVLIKISSEKTLSVKTEYRIFHQKYKKIIKKSKNYSIHFDTNEKLEIGDLIEFMSCRPISKTKKWVYTRKIKGKSWYKVSQF